MSQPPKAKSPLSSMFVPFIVFMIVYFAVQYFEVPPKAPNEKVLDTSDVKVGQDTTTSVTSDAVKNAKKTAITDNVNTNAEIPVEKPKLPELPKVVEHKEVITTFNLGHRRFEFTTKGASINTAYLAVNEGAGIHGEGIEILEKTKSNIPHFAVALDGEAELTTRHWKIIAEVPDTKIVYELVTSSGLKATKTFTVVGDYVLNVDLQIEFSNLQDKKLVLYGATGIRLEGKSADAVMQSGGFFIGQRKNDSQLLSLVTFADLKSHYEIAKGEGDLSKAAIFNYHEDAIAEAKLLWMGLKNKYFMVVAQPPAGYRAFVKYFVPKNNEIEKEPNGIMALTTTLGAESKISISLPVYIGPRQKQAVLDAKLGDGIEKALEEEGFFLSFSSIEKIFLSILNSIYSFIGSYGWAIIVLTICVRAAIHPLMRFSQTRMQESSEKMALLQPKIEAIKKKYAKDPKELQKQQMKLMTENNAMGGMMLGCLPMLLQMPIYVALFSMIRSFIEFRGSSFGPISDLSLPDQLIPGGWNILPFLTLAVTVASMVRGMKRNNANKKMTPEQKMQQKMMYFIMPPFLLFITYGFSSGLLLYWFTSGLIGTLEAEYIRARREKLKKKASAPIGQLKPTGK